MKDLLKTLSARSPAARWIMHKGLDRLNWIRFVCHFLEFRRRDSQSVSRFTAYWRDRAPCLKDIGRRQSFDRHYVYHTAWAARALAHILPEFHADFASSLYFSGVVLAFVPVKFYDYRPVDLRLTRFSSESADLTALPFEDRCLSSVSCMHVVEHIGLGRYGDRLDPEGDLKAISELTRILAPDGHLLFVVPVGSPRIMFNAHRIYSFEQIRDYFSSLWLKEFVLIPDDPLTGGLISNASPEMVRAQKYACGCFWFQRT